MNSLDTPLLRFTSEQVYKQSNCITPEHAAMGLWKNYVILLDVRTAEEVRAMHMPFAVHVPLSELPQRAVEVENSFVVPFSGSVFRTGLAWLWLKAVGYSKVLALPYSIENILGHLKPCGINQLGNGHGKYPALEHGVGLINRNLMEDIHMSDLGSVLKEMNFSYLGNGKHCVTGSEFHKLLKVDDVLFLDVRTDEEQLYSKYPWAEHIPLHDLPSRVGELPEDKLIVPFCSSVFRASIAWGWLRAKGFSRVRTLILSTEEISTLIKPTPLIMNR
ncbi:rhodanese-like domain-containing protein [Desulfovibrio sp. JC010]|uniref:rhodanese-like domain-containing protein n=1 Tax=Desulfovibrio sp. JC010 TaxID=2593641 RepID=UPI0013D8AC8F|nr:rhodanese-like domain-containing protein [Desulfovibrio sp. JC010]NDV25071.1 rhodanese-like domain-containing protein [Desulfovibrio sp. JC010]